MEYVDIVFGQYEVSDVNYICVTRNADIAPDDEALEVSDDFRYLMKETLHKRRRMAVVRLEVAEKFSRIWKVFLRQVQHQAEPGVQDQDADEAGLCVRDQRESAGIHEALPDLSPIFTAEFRPMCRKAAS